MWYGKALMEVAREETDQLLFSIKEDAGTQDGAPSSFEEAVTSILSTPAKLIQGSSVEQKKNDTSAPSNENSTPSTENQTKMEVVEAYCSEAPTNETEQPSTLSEKDDQGADSPNAMNEADESTETFQIAWEWLDTARLLYHKALHDPSSSLTDAQKAPIAFQYADVLCTLGQLGLETDNVPSAVEDLSECLSLRCELLPSTDRTVAETHFYLGMAFHLSGRLTEALAEFDRARLILTKILADTTLSAGMRSQLQEVLHELDVKATESQQQLSGADKVEASQVKEALAELSRHEPAPVAVPTGPVRDLGAFGSSSRSKKRKEAPSSPSSSEQPEAKKSKTE